MEIYWDYCNICADNILADGVFMWEQYQVICDSYLNHRPCTFNCNSEGDFNAVVMRLEKQGYVKTTESDYSKIAVIPTIHDGYFCKKKEPHN